jgi:glycosyltransferase involved in cell wall biosynthesis
VEKDFAPDLTDVTVLTVNYRTADLTKRCVTSFRAQYPQVRFILIDNGSGDDSTSYIRYAAIQYPNISAILNQDNRFHGPALDQGIRASNTRFVFTLDSDCEVKRGGFLEAMVRLFEDASLYAAGMLLLVDQFGFSLPLTREKGISYIHPSSMLLDRDKYSRLVPFMHHGAPCLSNMRQAIAVGFTVRDFPVTEYISHEWRGTAGKYGYGLGPMTYLQSLVSLKLIPALRRLRGL